MKFSKYIRCTLLLSLVLLACFALAGCGKTKKTADIRQFCSACENDGLAVSSAEAGVPESDLIEYAAYGHDQEKVLVRFYHFKDEATAKDWYTHFCESAERGPSATTYEMKGNNFLSYTITADRAYTVITQVEDTLAAATGSLTFKSALDRIMLSIGYLSSNL